MKKKFVVLFIFTIMSLNAWADGLVYDPSEYKKTVSKTADKTFTSAKSIETKTQEAASYAQNSISGQSSNFNNALYELDSAQVNIRNELLDYQAKYEEIDTQYKLLKEQRRVLAEQIKQVNRKVNAIEKSKNQIRKTMT